MTFLRPVCTDYLFKQLQKQSLNVYGAEGQGRERLLLDLQALAKPAEILVLVANMKVFAKNYAGFIKDLTQQLAWQMAIENSALSLADRMRIVGANLGKLHTKALSEGLFELRLKGSEGIARVFYCTLVNRRIVMLHSFVKKTQKIPPRELRIAQNRLKEIKNADL